METTGRSPPTVGAKAKAGDAIERSPPSLGQRPDGRARVDDVLQLGRPDRRVLDLDVADAADAGLDPFDVLPDHLLGQLNLHAEHQLLALALGLDLLGRELRLRRHEADLSGDRALRYVVDGDAPLGADLDGGGLLRR